MKFTDDLVNTKLLIAVVTCFNYIKPSFEALIEMFRIEIDRTCDATF